MHGNGVYFHQKQRIKKRFLVRNDCNIANSNQVGRFLPISANIRVKNSFCEYDLKNVKTENRPILYFPFRVKKVWIFSDCTKTCFYVSIHFPCLFYFRVIHFTLQYIQRVTYKMYSLTSNSMTTTFHVNPFIQGIIPEHDFIVITR